MSLMNGGVIEKRVKIYEKIKLFGTFASALAYIGGIVYFMLLSHETFIHRTYLSELPGLLKKIIFCELIVKLKHIVIKRARICYFIIMICSKIISNLKSIKLIKLLIFYRKI